MVRCGPRRSPCSMAFPPAVSTGVASFRPGPCPRRWAQAAAGVPAVVRHGKTGLLTPEGDVQAYAAAIRELVLDDAKRKAYGRAARDFVFEERSLRLAAVKLGLILRGAAS